MGLLKKQADCNISNQERVKNLDPFYRSGFLEGKSLVDIGSGQYQPGELDN
jgi:hypothetical protein